MAIAKEQLGYFTAQQALAAGYTYQEQRHHTLDWKVIAAAQLRRVADLRTPAPEVVDELRQRRDGRGRFTKAANG